MHSACHKVEEGTVLNPAHSYHAHPSISSTSTIIELCKTWTINFPPPPGRSAYSPLPFGERVGVRGWLILSVYCLCRLATPSHSDIFMKVGD